MEAAPGDLSIHRRHIQEPKEAENGIDIFIPSPYGGQQASGAGDFPSQSPLSSGSSASTFLMDMKKSTSGMFTMPMGTQIYVVVLFIAWNLFSSLAQNSTKAVLSEISLTMTVTLLQFISIICFCVALMKASLVPTQPLSWGLAKTSTGFFYVYTLLVKNFTHLKPRRHGEHV
jgi:hypothetical protein